MTIPGYILAANLRKDRTDMANGLGGGLLVYGKVGIELLTNDNLVSNFTQYCRFKISTRSTLLNFVLAYQPPSSRQENTEEICVLLRRVDNNTIVIGDINMPDIDWSAGRAGARGRLLLETMLEEDLLQMVSFATHIKGNTLDLVITNCPEKVLTVTDGGRLGKSDHCIIVVEVECDIQRQVSKQITKNWSRANFEGVRSMLEGIDWKVLLGGGSVEDAWSQFF